MPRQTGGAHVGTKAAPRGLHSHPARNMLERKRFPAALFSAIEGGGGGI